MNKPRMDMGTAPTFSYIIFILLLEYPDLCFSLLWQDYFTNANRELEKDAQQDYHLDYAMENSTHTVIEFTRDLHTCDANDKRITVRRVSVNTLMGNVCLHIWSSW